MTKLLWSAVIMVLVLSGCGWDGTPTKKNDVTPLTSITVSADYSTIAVGTSTKLKVTGNFSGLFTRDVTDQVTWTGSSGVAEFTMPTLPNRVKGVASGSATVTATVGTLSASVPITVSSAAISTVTITPAAPSVAVGLAQQFTATGLFSDATTQDTTSQDITFDATWASDTTATATVSDASATKGLAQAVDLGTSTISATFGTVSGTTLMTVTAPVLQSIAISPSAPTVLTLTTTKFTAEGTYSDGNKKDITATASWSSANTSYVTVNGAAATALRQGTTAVTATLGSVSTSTDLTATGGNLTAITLNPSVTALVKGVARSITASGTFSNGTTRDITKVITWTPDNSSLVTVSTTTGNLAWLNPIAVTPVGTGTTLKATATSTGVITATVQLSVTAPALSSIEFSATNLAVNVGTGTTLGVTAHFNDGTTQDVTTLSTWTPSDTAKATVDAGGGGTERVTGVAAGLPAATISATYGSETVPTKATVAVTKRTLQKLTISGTATVGVGNQVSYSATATYTDGFTLDVTAEPKIVWSIDSPDIALFADSDNQPGQIVGLSAGSANLTATFGGETSPKFKITVTGP